MRTFDRESLSSINVMMLRKMITAMINQMKLLPNEKVQFIKRYGSLDNLQNWPTKKCVDYLLQFKPKPVYQGNTKRTPVKRVMPKKTLPSVPEASATDINDLQSDLLDII